ncbi:MAG: YaiO family outer membrane beta-barrel protein [Pyrinomonadaceae bacterium]|nr:YaiO family outer membrane beta-barrel protein [Pyrinomonadaceae bacterium]
MRTLNKISLRFVIALIIALGTNHVTAQESAPTPQASPSPAAQTMIVSDHFQTSGRHAPDNLNEEQTASQRKSETARPASERLEVEAGYSYEHLTNGFAPWRSAHLFVGKKFASRQSLYGIYRETWRVGQRDREGLIGFYQPLGHRWAVLLEANASSTHRILPKWSALAQVERQFGQGWVGSAGYRHTVYNTAQVSTGTFTVERYFSRYRAAYTLYVSGLEGAGTSASHRGQFNYYYGEQSSTLGVSFAAGRELENLGTRILRTGVQSFAIQGRHWLNSRWGMNYDSTLHRQGDIYTRRGFSVGLRYRF